MTDERFQFHIITDTIEIDENYGGESVWKETVRRFCKNKGAVAGLICLVLIIFFSIFAPMVSPYTYDEAHMEWQNLPPRVPGLEKLGILDGTRNGIDLYEQLGIKDRYFLFGTDYLGRDQWTRVFSGTRISLLVAVIAVSADVVIGVTYGLISGYYGGTVDIVMQRIVEVVHGIPTLVVVTMLMLVLKPGIGSIVVALLISGWIGMSRMVRSQIMKLKELEYVLASKSLGASDRSIIFGQILPNTVGQILVLTMTSIPSAVFMESFLSYIGLGIPAPNTSLGILISDGYGAMMMYPYLLAVPVAMFAILMISLNLFGDGLRDALDPKQKDV